MANTYTQIHIMAVWAVKFRHGLILPPWKENLYPYINVNPGLGVYFYFFFCLEANEAKIQGCVFFG